MKLASIVPMRNAIRTFDGDYAMLLAHLKDYYPENPNIGCYVIMDNSLIELGGAVDIQTVYDAALQCNANEFILPDVFRNGPATVAEVIKSISYMRKHDMLGRFHLMAVCQGSTRAEFEWCFKQLIGIHEIHCIGIPKVANELTPNGRPGLEYLWVDNPSNKCIHLLGCWKTLDEFRQYKYPELIRSCDTCIPALLSTKKIYDAWVPRPEKTIDLIHDRIKPACYEEIREQLMREGLL